MGGDKFIKLLSNEPCRKDAFEGRAHQNIAEQVSKIIKEDDERHIIGIEGGWGSGKSNLISLVNINLNGEKVYDKDFDHKNSPYPFFVYDAWGHQADFQRRAILEELTHDLTNEKKILGEKKWKRKLDELLAKRKKTTTKEVPHLGFGLIMSILLCVLTPLVAFFVNIVPEHKWWLRLLIAIAPYFIGFIWVICDRIRSIKKNNQELTIANIFSEIILVYKDQIKENETYTTISEKEPSSAEFKQWMDDVDSDLEPLKKTLVIVFDNMDRLPSQKVESLWSSIHSFFSDKTYKNIKVLIPFDRRHVQQAFRNEDTSEESFGNDFINKTFDVVFRVPPPIMTGWQLYMQDMWKKAFGKDAELSISVTQIYDALSKNHTPRKIIAFVNEIAAVKMTMRDEIPDRYIALFVFGKEEIERNPIGQLLSPSFMGDVKFEYEKDPNTIKYLSALYYQLPVEKALDVIFTREATDALNSGNAERLHEMMEHIELSTILSNAILKVTNIEKASSTLSALDGYYGYKGYEDLPKWLIKIWKDLYQKCKNDNVVWDEIKPYHIELFSHLRDNQLAEDLISGYLSIEDAKWDAELYVKTIDKLKENNDIIDQKLVKHKRNVTSKLFLELLKHTKENYQDYGVSYELKELDSYLAGLERQDVLSLDVIPYIAFKEEDELTAYKAKLQEWLGDISDMEASDVGILFTRLKEVSEKPIQFEQFFDDRSVVNEWNELKDEDNLFKYDLLSMRIARRDAISSPYADYFQSFIEDYTDDDVKKLADVIEYYVDYGSLTLNSDYYKEYPIVVAVFDYLTRNNRGGSRANILDCLYHFDKTVDDYEIDGDPLFDKLNGWNQYVEVNKINVEKIPSGLLAIVIDNENKIAVKIKNACQAHYASLSQDQWKEHAIKKDNTYRIWKVYHPKKYQANFDALKSVLKDYASGAVSTQPDRNLVSDWLAICIEVKHSIKGLFSDISGILKKDSAITKAKLLYFGSWILEYTDNDKQKDFIERLIPSEIIDVDVVDFIAIQIDKLQGCNIPDDFKEKIKHLAETSMKGQEAISVICNSLGIAIEEPKQDNDENG